MRPADELLAVTGVHLERSGRALLRAVSVTMRAGEHWAVLGANGAGKSTLLALMGARIPRPRASATALAAAFPAPQP